MTELKITISNDLEKKIKEHPDINWASIASSAIENYLINLEGMNIIKELSRFSEMLQKAKTHEEKILLLVKFDPFLKENRMFIKKNCPDKLVSILRSL